MTRVLRCLVGWILFVGSPALFAAIHPVPLQPNTDSAKCIECHEDKAKGKNVHSAIATGCTSCHEIRVAKDVTRIKLTTVTPQALCLTCHANMNAAELKGTVHPPAVRDCLKCHDPHQSSNKYQLLKPTSGDKGQNLCLDCHTEGLNVPKDGSRHAALDMGCETCHNVHKVGERGQQQFDYHLTKAAPELCIDCHDPKSEDLQKAHKGQPFGSANCVQCHNPHQSSQAHLMQKFTHPPFVGGDCATCHAAPKDGKVVLTQADAKSICITCHSDQAEKIDKAKVPHPGAQGDCTSCHNPHAGKTPGFVQPDPVNACVACHSEQAEGMKKAHLHQPAYKDGCATCHEPHGSDNQHLLRKADVNSLCLECHGPDSQPEKNEAAQTMTIFGGKVTLQMPYKVPALPLKYGAGHPVEFHPVSGKVDPKSKTSPEMTCLTCHQPHSSAQRGLLVKDQQPDMAFCNTCHRSSQSPFVK